MISKMTPDSRKVVNIIIDINIKVGFLLIKVTAMIIIRIKISHIIANSHNSLSNKIHINPLNNTLYNNTNHISSIAR